MIKMNRLVLLATFFATLTPSFAQSATRPKVVVRGLEAPQLEELRQAVPEAEIVGATAADLAEQVIDADAIIGPCSADLINQAPRLRWIQTFSAGVEGCAPLLADREIVLTNAKIVMGPEISDHALALLLALTRSLRQTIAAQSRGEWQRDNLRPIELRGKTALVIGVGGIGTQIAERAAAFGMRVLGVDPKDVPYINSIEQVVPPEQLNQLLPEADVVFMAAPHTRESDKMLGEAEFSLMKRGAYFINVSRGKTTDTQALVNALVSGRLAGAGIDVVDPEPLPTGHALWQMDNVVITPHIAGQSDQLDGRRTELFKQNIRRFTKGLPLINVVDKRRGY
jgi:phosphoglycerate dehydrogenase-like enzyme